MTQPTQEDKVLIARDLLGAKVQAEVITQLHRPGLPPHPPMPVYFIFPDGRKVYEKDFNPYTDDSFTGALVKAVFPLLAEQMWFIEIFEDGIYIQRYRKWEAENVLKAPNLNTALIEAYFKIEGEKNGNNT